MRVGHGFDVHALIDHSCEAKPQMRDVGLIGRILGIAR